MADAPTIQIIENGFRNVVLNVSMVSDGSGLSNYKVFDAASATFGVTIGGQTFFPGLQTKVTGLNFDVQDMKFTLSWDATVPQLFFTAGASPEDFSMRDFGGVPVPPGLAGATGSILLNTVDPMPDATLFFQLKIRKAIKQ